VTESPALQVFKEINPEANGTVEIKSLPGMLTSLGSMEQLELPEPDAISSWVSTWLDSHPTQQPGVVGFDEFVSVFNEFCGAFFGAPQIRSTQSAMTRGTSMYDVGDRGSVISQ